MSYAMGPSWPAEETTNAELGEFEKRHKRILMDLSERLGQIIAGGNEAELLWLLMALRKVSILAAEKADELIDKNKKMN